MNVYSSRVTRQPYAEMSQAPLTVYALMDLSWTVKTSLVQVCHMDSIAHLLGEKKEMSSIINTFIKNLQIGSLENVLSSLRFHSRLHNDFTGFGLFCLYQGHIVK